MKISKENQERLESKLEKIKIAAKKLQNIDRCNDPIKLTWIESNNLKTLLDLIVDANQR